MSVPLCKDCAHFDGGMDVDYCIRPIPRPLDPVHGKTTRMLLEDAWTERHYRGGFRRPFRCGPEGQYFEAKPGVVE